MAHYEKFSRRGLGHIFAHTRRAYRITEDGRKEYVKFSNREIDTSRSHLNYNLSVDENGRGRNQQKRYESIMNGETLPEGYSLIVNKRADLKVVCSWIITMPENVRPGDERKFFEAVYRHLKTKYPHDVSAWVHNDEGSTVKDDSGTRIRGHLHYLFCPIYHDPKKDTYKVSSNELVNRNELKKFHNELSEAVAEELGYEVSIMTGDSELRRENGLRGSIDILKYKAQKLAEEYRSLKEQFQDEGLELSANMASYITETGQKDYFLEYQKQLQEKEEMRYEYGR